jgi:hypothetical protein
MTTRNDARYTTSDDPHAILRASINGADMGGWLDGDRSAFESAVVDEAAHGFGLCHDDVEEVTIETVKLDADTITEDHIRALRDEAKAAGDKEQAAVCDAALAGDDDARDACAEAINAARAML